MEILSDGSATEDQSVSTNKLLKLKSNTTIKALNVQPDFNENGDEVSIQFFFNFLIAILKSNFDYRTSISI